MSPSIIRCIQRDNAGKVTITEARGLWFPYTSGSQSDKSVESQ